MSNHTFTADGSLPSLFGHQQRYSTLRIGAEGKATFGGGTLKIQIVTEDGGRHTIREITALSELDNNAVIIEQPSCQIDIDLSGATNPNLYVEHKEFRDNESQR